MFLSIELNKAIVQITDELLVDDLLIWDNGFYPYKIPFEIGNIKKVLHEGLIKDSFLKVYQFKYGWTIFYIVILDSEVSNNIIQ